MGRKQTNSKRRAPTQDRARLTVDAILEAATHVLVTNGYDGATTNRIAAAAGVSTGSLYQYFANRDEIVAAMLERHCERMLAVVTTGLCKYDGLGFESLVRTLIRSLWSAFQVDHTLYQVLRAQLPRVARFHKLDALLSDARDAVAMFLAMQGPTLRVTEPTLAAFLIVHAVDGIFTAALGKPEMTVDRERFLKETGDLALMYLRKLETVP